MELIPVMNTKGDILEYMDADYLQANQGYFLLRYNRRGNLRSAIRRERSSLVPLSRKGECKDQTLSTGHVIFALRGTPGSQSSNMAFA